MNYYTFRKLDKEILYISFTKEQDESSWKACLLNEGGVEDDFLRLESEEWIEEMKASFNDNNEVVFIPNPVKVAKEARRNKVRNKLKEAIPGLTDEDLDNLR